VPAAEELNADEEPVWLAELLAEIDLIIIGIRAEDAAQKRHWRGLRRDLPLMVRAARTARGIAPDLAASTLSAVIAAVQTAILLYHLQLGDR